jgi:Transposase IS200 like
MGRRALRPLARTRLPLSRLPRLLRLSGRCRFDSIAITRLHIHTVRRTTDNPDLPTCPTQCVVAACTLFVSNDRRPVCTGQMLTRCEHTMRTVCAELDVDLIEFNGEADHMPVLVADPPTLAISTLV